MSILADLLLNIFESGIGSSSERGLVATFTSGSVVLSIGTVLLLTTARDPLRQPEWGMAVLAGSVLCGAAGLLLSALHLRRNQADRVFGLACLALKTLVRFGIRDSRFGIRDKGFRIRD